MRSGKYFTHLHNDSVCVDFNVSSSVFRSKSREILNNDSFHRLDDMAGRYGFHPFNPQSSLS